jgi:tetrahydromethanopterin:alpha-L-glutamate ligase
MKIGVAGIPGAWSTERLATSLRDAGAESFVFSLADVVHDLGCGHVEVCGRDLRGLAAVVVKKLDQSSPASRLRLHPLRALESAGVRVFSPPDVIDRAMDRYRMTMILAEHEVPTPTTLSAGSGQAMVAAINAVGDAVLKPVYTSKGRGMFRVNGQRDVLETMDGEPYLVQRFVDAPGRDIGATVIGGQFVGAFYRVARDGEWMTTTSVGGSYAPCTLSDGGVEYAERAARAFGLAYTVVDLVELADDFLVYEVSAFGGFRGLLEASGIDAAALYARHVVRELSS